MINSNTSRYDVFKSDRRVHRGKNFKDLVNSASWKSYKQNILENAKYKLSTIPDGMENRPDLISLAAYGTVNLWWVICEANDIFDPHTQLVAGKQIKIPII